MPTILFSSLSVKPDPPESVVAKPVPNNPRRLEVSWQNPSSWPDPESFPLKFFLRYRPLILDQWQHVSDAAVPGMRGRGAACDREQVIKNCSGTKKMYIYCPGNLDPVALLFLVAFLFLSIFLVTHTLPTNGSAASPCSVFSSMAPIYFPYICSI